MEDLAEDDAGETSAVKSKCQQIKPSKQKVYHMKHVTTAPDRDWFRECVGGARRCDAHQERARRAKRFSRSYGFSTDGWTGTNLEK